MLQNEGKPIFSLFESGRFTQALLYHFRLFCPICLIDKQKMTCVVIAKKRKKSKNVPKI